MEPRIGKHEIDCAKQAGEAESTKNEQTQ